MVRTTDTYVAYNKDDFCQEKKFCIQSEIINLQTDRAFVSLLLSMRRKLSLKTTAMRKMTLREFFAHQVK